MAGMIIVKARFSHLEQDSESPDAQCRLHADGRVILVTPRMFSGGINRIAGIPPGTEVYMGLIGTNGGFSLCWLYCPGIATVAPMSADKSMLAALVFLYVPFAFMLYIFLSMLLDFPVLLFLFAFLVLSFKKLYAVVCFVREFFWAFLADPLSSLLSFWYVRSGGRRLLKNFGQVEALRRPASYRYAEEKFMEELEASACDGPSDVSDVSGRIHKPRCTVRGTGSASSMTCTYNFRLKEEEYSFSITSMLGGRDDFFPGFASRERVRVITDRQDGTVLGVHRYGDGGSYAFLDKSSMHIYRHRAFLYLLRSFFRNNLWARLALLSVIAAMAVWLVRRMLSLSEGEWQALFWCGVLLVPVLAFIFVRIREHQTQNPSPPYPGGPARQILAVLESLGMEHPPGKERAPYICMLQAAAERNASKWSRRSARNRSAGHVPPEA